MARSNESRAAGAINRLPGEKFADFAARQRDAQLSAMPVKKARKPLRRSKTAEQRAADRVDGFDRDDIGESPDY